MTTKQRLVAHLEDRHWRRKAGTRRSGFRAGFWRTTDTLAELQRAHGYSHHHESPDHYHAGNNLGPNDRPLGWKTGADVIETTPA